MLAGVDYVIMGAGIPVQIPGVLNQLAQGLPASMRVHVEQSEPSDDFRVTFDPCAITGGRRLDIRRPFFVPIISSATLGEMLISKSSGVVDGFVVEGPTAGGHNAPPRGKMVLNDKGEPVYGPRDRMDFDRMRSLGLPFWVAGSYGSPEKLKGSARTRGGGRAGRDSVRFVQRVGAGRRPATASHRACAGGQVSRCLPTRWRPHRDFPFKVAQIEGTLLRSRGLRIPRARLRQWDICGVRTRKPDGSIGLPLLRSNLSPRTLRRAG